MRSSRRVARTRGAAPTPDHGGFRAGPLATLAEAVEADLVAGLAPGGDDLVAIDQTPAPGDWRRRIRPLLRRLRPDARLVFNALSQDYLDLTAAAAPATRGRARRASLSVSELTGFATASRLAVGAVRPYGALLGHPFGGRSPLAPLDGSHRWRRGLSWLARDEGLAELLRFLEQRVVPGLPAGAAPYVMVVVERRVDPDGNAAVADHHRRVLDGLTAASLAELARAQAGPGETLAGRLDPLLAPLRARVFAFELLDQLTATWPALDPSALLSPARAEQYSHWRLANQVDREATRLAREWSDGCPERVLDGTDLTVSLDYGLVRGILEQYFDLYEERLG